MTPIKKATYYKGYEFKRDDDPEGNREWVLDKEDNIKEELESLCIRLNPEPSFEPDLDEPPKPSDTLYLLFSPENNTLCYLRVNPPSGISNYYRRSVDVQLSPPSELPKKLSDLLEAKGFRKEESQ
jgi:hypothetical protein